MREFVGRQSALPLKGSYLVAMKMIYLLILWLIQEIKKPRRAASREDFSVLCMNLKFKRAGERFFSPGASRRAQLKPGPTSWGLEPPRSYKQPRGMVCGTVVLTQKFHTLCRPTCVGQGASENGQSFLRLLFQVLFQKGRFTSQTWGDVLVRYTGNPPECEQCWKAYQQKTSRTDNENLYNFFFLLFTVLISTVYN